MSFGTYGGVAFSSFKPEVPAGSSDMAADDEDGESPAAISLNRSRLCTKVCDKIARVH